jgi:hypothetical protein
VERASEAFKRSDRIAENESATSRRKLKSSRIRESDSRTAWYGRAGDSQEVLGCSFFNDGAWADICGGDLEGMLGVTHVVGANDDLLRLASEALSADAGLPDSSS